MLDPALLSRQYGVRSMNPIGTMQTLPSRRYAGTALPSGPFSHGLLPPPVAPCGRGFGFAIETGSAEGSGAGPGITGVRLATLPRFGRCAPVVLEAEVLEFEAPAAPDVPITLSINCC